MLKTQESTLLRDLEPGPEIADVLQLAVDPGVAAQERRAHLRDQLSAA